MNIIRWGSLILFVTVMAAFSTGHRSWELLAAALVLAIVVLWSCGAVARGVWFGTPEQDAECVRIDEELDAIDRAYRRP